MNKTSKGLLNFFANSCFVLTLCIICKLIVNIFTEQQAMPNSFVIQSIIISFAGSLLQWIAFSEDFIKKMKYVYRNIIFVVPYFIMLSGMAYWGNWFNTNELSYWISFVIIFIVIYIVIAISFSIFFKVTGQKYNEKLEKYKANK